MNPNIEFYYLEFVEKNSFAAWRRLEPTLLKVIFSKKTLKSDRLYAHSKTVFIRSKGL
jgi:hypothetical protein